MEAQQQTRNFWSFAVTRREISVRGQEPNVAPVLTVEGYFIYCKHIVQGLNEETAIFPLTPLGETVRLEVPPWFFGDKAVDEINARDIVNQFAELLATPFEIVGPPPLDIPIGKIPPSKRKTVIAAAQKARKKGFAVPPPDGG